MILAAIGAGVDAPAVGAAPHRPRRGAGACRCGRPSLPRSRSPSWAPPPRTHAARRGSRGRAPPRPGGRRDRDGLVLHPDAVARRPPHRLHREGAAVDPRPRAARAARGRGRRRAVAARVVDRLAHAGLRGREEADAGRGRRRSPQSICAVPDRATSSAPRSRRRGRRLLDLARRHVPGPGRRGRADAAVRQRSRADGRLPRAVVASRRGAPPRRPLAGARGQRRRGQARRWRCSTAPGEPRSTASSAAPAACPRRSRAGCCTCGATRAPASGRCPSMRAAPG